MTRTVDELLAIKDLPEFLRTEHCYNDLQHAMLVVLFRHVLTALKSGKRQFANTVFDNISMYLYIHFLNEEEGLVYKAKNDFITRHQLQEHSELHVKFLDHWRDKIVLPYKKEEIGCDETLEKMSDYYNLIIKHIDHMDIPAYGADVMEANVTRMELARIGVAGMSMSPFMAGAFQTVDIMDSVVAASVDRRRISPRATDPLGTLDLVTGFGRVLSGSVGSLRDRFAQTTRGDRNPNSACFKKLPKWDEKSMPAGLKVA